jgi:hypothetical protein
VAESRSDDVLVVAVDPSGEGHEQHLQGGDIGRHGPILPGLIPDPVTRSGPTEFSDTTGSAMFRDLTRTGDIRITRGHDSA